MKRLAWIPISSRRSRCMQIANSSRSFNFCSMVLRLALIFSITPLAEEHTGSLEEDKHVASAALHNTATWNPTLPRHNLLTPAYRKQQPILRHNLLAPAYNYHRYSDTTSSPLPKQQATSITAPVSTPGYEPYRPRPRKVRCLHHRPANHHSRIASARGR